MEPAPDLKLLPLAATAPLSFAHTYFTNVPTDVIILIFRQLSFPELYRLSRRFDTILPTRTAKAIYHILLSKLEASKPTHKSILKELGSLKRSSSLRWEKIEIFFNCVKAVDNLRLLLQVRREENALDCQKNSTLSKLLGGSPDVNQLVSGVQKEIAWAKALKKFPATLIFHKLNLFGIPPEISLFNKVVSFTCTDDSLTFLSDRFKMLHLLTSLNLSDNKFREFPDVLFKLTSLVKINLSGNQIVYLGEGWKSLKKLENLNLKNNELKSLPLSFAGLSSLAVLELSYNKLTSVPFVLHAIRSLESANFYNNSITFFPCSIGPLSQKSKHDKEFYERKPFAMTVTSCE